MKAGGGKNILYNLIRTLSKGRDQNKYLIIVPNKKEFEKYESDRIRIMAINYLNKMDFLYPIFNSFHLLKLIRKFEADCILNFSDIPAPTPCHVTQVFVFDWAFAVYPENINLKLLGLRRYLYARLKLFFFCRYLPYISTICSQTNLIKTKIERTYRFNNIMVVPNAFCSEKPLFSSEQKYDLPTGIKMLYLTNYYPHKNIEVFIPLAKEIKALGLNFNLITTIGTSKNKKAMIFLREIKENGLDDIIVDIGNVSFDRLPMIYSQCQALLMPTLLESFSTAYLEAMLYGVPIFTSDLDFAHEICGDSAFYFDPRDATSILNTIKDAFDNQGAIEEKITQGKKQLEKMLSWEQVANKYIEIIEKGRPSQGCPMGNC